MISLKNYLDDFRENISSDAWSQAVTKSRLITTARVSIDGPDFLIILKDPNLARAIKVKLSTEDFYYSTDCHCDDDPCVHLVAATIIANSRDKIDKVSSNGVSTLKSKIVYVASLNELQELVLKREVIFEDNIVILKSSLAEFIGGFTSGRRKGEAPLASREDFLLDRYFSNANNLILSEGLSEELEKILYGMTQVFFETKETEQKEVVRRSVIFEKNKNQIELNYQYEKGELCIDFDSTLRKKFLVLNDKIIVLPNLFGPTLLGSFKSVVDNRIIINSENLESFISEYLPQIQRSGFHLKGNALPVFSSEPCSLSFEIDILDSGISVLPVIVYGNPSIAQIRKASFSPVDWLYLPKRNSEKELELFRFCKSNFGLSFDKQTILSGEQVPIFYSRLKAAKISCDSHQEIFDLVPKIDNKNGFPEVVFENDILGYKLSLSEVSDSYFADKRFIKQGDSWFQIPITWLNQVKNGLKRSSSGGGPAHVGSASETSSALNSLKLLPFLEDVPDDYFRSWVTENYKSTFNSSSTFEIMRPYQRYGSLWLNALREAKLPGALLADDMGLGKTLQVISIIRSYTLVVCPTSLLKQWKLEIEKFRSDISVSIYHGAGRELVELSDQPQVIITSYGVMKRDIELLNSKHWDLLVVDEAQNIKNPNSDNFLKIIQLNANFKVSLTGTPIENSIEDLVSILDFSVPGLLSKGMDFAEIKKVSSSFILRRRKKEVLKDLPEKTEVLVSCEQSLEEKTIYEGQFLKAKEMLNDSEVEMKSINILEQILRLRQIAVDPKLAGFITNGHSTKISKAAELILSSIAQGRKVLVFSQWTSALDLMELKLKQDSIRFDRIDGSTSNRSTIVDEFQNTDSSDVLLLSLKAGGVGLNLTSASDVIFLDTWWNPAAESQAMDRVHRIGQLNPVFVYKLISEDTIEEKILNLQNHKLSVYDDVMSNVEEKARIEMKDLVDLLS